MRVRLVSTASCAAKPLRLPRSVRYNPIDVKLGFYWKSIMRWCLLGTVVMFVWLMIPTARCSIQALRDTPLPEAGPHEQAAPQSGDDGQPTEEPGFFSKLGSAMSRCYSAKPLFGQESWKSTLLVAFAALTALAWTMKLLEERSKRSYEDR
jgi:hypothetical protein